MMSFPPLQPSSTVAQCHQLTGVIAVQLVAAAVCLSVQAFTVTVLGPLYMSFLL